MNPWGTFERDFDEQLAGTTASAQPATSAEDQARARKREATPAPLWQPTPGHEL